MEAYPAAGAAQGTRYLGLPLSRCARLMATAHGGQVVLSEATAALVRDALPARAGLLDLGEYRLQDLQRPERVFQLTAPGLPGDFPACAPWTRCPNNLPLQLTSFVGRERELAEVAALLGAHRLLTLTGPGGTGKTRLALQAAADALEQYPDGVWLAELAALADPGLVPQAVAQAVGVREEPARPLLATLAEVLRPKRLLLVLDNCEHLVGLDEPSGAHGFDPLEGEASGEDGEASEEGALGRGEQVVGPFDERLEGLVAAQRAAPASGQEAEAIVQPGRDLVDAEHAHPRGGELDGQGDAVQTVADLASAGPFWSVTRKAGSTATARSTKRRTAPYRSRLRAVGAGAPSGSGGPGRASDGTRQAVSPGTPSGSRLVAKTRMPGHWRRTASASGAQELEDVLAVVQEEERVARLEVGEERGLRGLARGLPRSQRGECGAGDERRVREGREVDEPDAVGGAVEATGHGLEGEAGLAHAPRAGQRHERARGQQALDLRELPLSPDEAGELARQRGGAGRDLRHRPFRRRARSAIELGAYPRLTTPPSLWRAPQSAPECPRVPQSERRAVKSGVRPLAWPCSMLPGESAEQPHERSRSRSSGGVGHFHRAPEKHRPDHAARGRGRAGEIGAPAGAAVRRMAASCAPGASQVFVRSCEKRRTIVASQFVWKQGDIFDT